MHNLVDGRTPKPCTFLPGKPRRVDLSHGEIHCGFLAPGILTTMDDPPSSWTQKAVIREG